MPDMDSKDEMCQENPWMMGCGLTKDQKAPEAQDDSFFGTVKKLGGHVWDWFTGTDNKPDAKGAQSRSDMNAGMY